MSYTRGKLASIVKNMTPNAHEAVSSHDRLTDGDFVDLSGTPSIVRNLVVNRGQRIENSARLTVDSTPDENKPKSSCVIL